MKGLRLPLPHLIEGRIHSPTLNNSVQVEIRLAVAKNINGLFDHQELLFANYWQAVITAELLVVFKLYAGVVFHQAVKRIAFQWLTPDGTDQLHQLLGT